MTLVEYSGPALRPRRIPEESLAVAGLGLAMAVATAVILWFGRGNTLWIDEIAVYLQSPSPGIDELFRPHVGHLVVTFRLADKAILELFGTSYLPFQMLTVGSLLLTVGLLFVYMRRRLPPLAALAPCLVLLFFGSDFIHILAGNGFVILFAVSCGLGALIALEDGTRWRDGIASALLVLGVATYSVALAFVAGAVVLILLGPNRWRRLWVVAIPILLYGVWLLWAAKFEGDAESQILVEKILLLPSWAFKSLSAVLSSLTGLDFEFAGATKAAEAGPALVTLAIVGFAFRFRQGRFSPALWAALAAMVALWALGAMASQGSRTPESSRYLYPGATLFLMVAAGCSARLRWSRNGLIGLFAVATCGLALNLYYLKENGTALRSSYAVQVKAGFAGVDLAGDSAIPGFEVPPVPGGAGFVPGNQSPVSYPFGIVALTGAEPLAAYRAAAERFGPLGYSLEEVRAAGDEVQTQTDSILVAALGFELETVADPPASSNCAIRRAGADGVVTMTLPRQGAYLTSASGGEVTVQRFARERWIPLRALVPGETARLQIPADRAPDEWRAAVGSPAASICPLR